MPDWPRILLELRQAGVTREQLAKATGKHPRTLAAYEDGIIREPPYSVGELILGLHRLYAVAPPAESTTGTGAKSEC